MSKAISLPICIAGEAANHCNGGQERPQGLISSPTDTKRTPRGRPAIEHDNSRAQAFLSCFHSTDDIREHLPALDDVQTGITHLQPEGQDSTRPLRRGLLLLVLQHCQTISTATVQAALGPAYSLSQIKRYALAARVASKVIVHNLNRHPSWTTLAELQCIE